MDKDIKKEDNVFVFDLVSKFGVESAMTKPTHCLHELLKQIKDEIEALY